MTGKARILLLSATFVAALVLSISVALIVSGRVTPPSVPQAAAIGGPFKLVDQNDRAFTEQDLKGRPVLIFFGFTNCPDVCPATLFQISEVLRRLGPDAARVRALFITVDPEHDTPKVLKDYLSNFDPI